MIEYVKDTTKKASSVKFDLRINNENFLSISTNDIK